MGLDKGDDIESVLPAADHWFFVPLAFVKYVLCSMFMDVWQ